MAHLPKSQSLDEPRSEKSRLGPNLTRDREKESAPAHGPNSEPHFTDLMKHDIHFHHVFKDIPPEEELLDTFSCAWQREVGYHGRLYVSRRHVCFYCSMTRREVKVTIPVSTVRGFKKANTALLVPNAICIRTSEREKFVFTTLRSRENVYQLLRFVCSHLQDGGQNRSLASTYTSPGNLIKILPDPGANPIQPEHETLQEEPNKNWAADVGDETYPVAEGLAEPPFQWPVMASSRVHVPKPPETRKERFGAFKTILFIYLFLVVALILSSGYIGLRLVQLEEQLSSLEAWPGFQLGRHG